MDIEGIVRNALRRAAWIAGLVVLCASPALATTLHPGDKIQVNVLNHPELLTQATLDSQGRVSLPILGLVDANALEPGALATRPATSLPEPWTRSAARSPNRCCRLSKASAKRILAKYLAKNCRRAW